MSLPMMVEEALVVLDRALQIDPNYAPAYNNKGWILGKLNRRKAAEEAHKRARALGYGG